RGAYPDAGLSSGFGYRRDSGRLIGDPTQPRGLIRTRGPSRRVEKEIRVQVFLGVSDRVLFFFERGFDSKVARQMPDHSHSFASSNLEKLVISLAGKISMDLYQIVTSLLLCNNSALDLFDCRA